MDLWPSPVCCDCVLVCRDGVEAASISEPINFKHDLHVSGLEDMTDEELVK